MNEEQILMIWKGIAVFHLFISIVLYTPLLFVVDSNKPQKFSLWVKLIVIPLNAGGLAFWLMVSIILNIIFGRNDKMFNKIIVFIKKIYLKN